MLNRLTWICQWCLPPLEYTHFLELDASFRLTGPYRYACLNSIHYNESVTIAVTVGISESKELYESAYRAMEAAGANTERLNSIPAMRAYNKLLTSRSAGPVSREFYMPRSTAYSWEAQKRKDGDWAPLETSRYGQHRRVFTKEEEDQIADYIRKEVLPTGLLLTDEACRRILIQKCHEKVLKNPGWCVPFTCSHGSVTDFKRRHGFAS